MIEQISQTPKTVPDFVIVGAAKSGTSTLYRYLDLHPQICFSREKEPCFFDRRATWDRGWNWYASLFEHAQKGQLLGEGSTNYTFWPHVPDAPALLAEHAPDAKLIYMMRHPVDRTYSHYSHRFTKELFPGKPFDQTVEEFSQSDPMILDCSHYMQQIEQFLYHFQRKQMLFLFMDELIENPTNLVKKVLNFLEVDDQIDLVAQGAIVDNKGSQHRDGKLRYYTTEPFRNHPIISKLAYALPKSFRTAGYNLVMRTPYGKRMRQAFNPIPMSPQARQHFVELFRAGNQELEKFLDIDLSHWNQ